MKKSWLQRADDGESHSPMMKRHRAFVAEEPPLVAAGPEALASGLHCSRAGSSCSLNTLALPTPPGSVSAVAYTLPISPGKMSMTDEIVASASSSTPNSILSPLPLCPPPSAAADDDDDSASDPNIAASAEVEVKSAADTLIAAANSGRPVAFPLPTSTKRTSRKKDTDDDEKSGTSINNVVAESTKTCMCVKSKCLKLYCECFSSGAPCGAECGMCEKFCRVTPSSACRHSFSL